MKQQHRREQPLPVNTSNDHLMVSEGLRAPKAQTLPREVYSTSKEQKKEFKRLARIHPLENKVMLSNKF